MNLQGTVRGLSTGRRKDAGYHHIHRLPAKWEHVEIPDFRSNEAIVERVSQYYQRWYAPLTPRWRKLVGDVLDLRREMERLEAIERDLSFSLKGKRVLEIGSGFGLFILAARLAGARVCGIEPEEDVCQTARMIFREGAVGDVAICRAVGERLPFGDGEFDMVCSFQVLEHTTDPAAVVDEALRVARPGGLLYFVIPNYNSFWESHYGVLWLPRLNKRVGKWVLRRLGRDPRFLDTLQYITPKRLRAILAEAAYPCEVVSWGIEKWRERLGRGQATRWGQAALLGRIVRLAKALRLNSLIAWLGEKLDFYYPIILVVRRR